MTLHYSRRTMLKGMAGIPFLLNHPQPQNVHADATKRLPVAAVVTQYHENSHADVIVGKILEGFQQDGGPGPALELAALYVDQFTNRDLSRALAKKHGFPIMPTIAETITLGTREVQVAGVLSIGEHGNYPTTPGTRQTQYPRRRFFDQITRTFRDHGKVVPVFNDKHLAYRWEDAKHMYDTAASMKIPLMAGSSLPVTWRLPATEIPRGAKIEAALAIGYGGFESYGFHALETLQCVTERRHGGETGVRSVQVVQGKEIEQARQAGRWSELLLHAAMEKAGISSRDTDVPSQLQKSAAFYLLDYRDGLQGTVAMLNGLGDQFGIALKLRGIEKPVANWFWLQDRKPYGHFTQLVRAIDMMIHQGKPVYPVERTLLTTGILDRVMHSIHQGGQRLETPELKIAYQPTSWGFANRDGNNPPPRL